MTDPHQQVEPDRYIGNLAIETLKIIQWFELVTLVSESEFYDNLVKTDDVRVDELSHILTLKDKLDIVNAIKSKYIPNTLSMVKSLASSNSLAIHENLYQDLKDTLSWLVLQENIADTKYGITLKFLIEGLFNTATNPMTYVIDPDSGLLIEDNRLVYMLSITQYINAFSEIVKLLNYIPYPPGMLENLHRDGVIYDMFAIIQYETLDQIDEPVMDSDEIFNREGFIFNALANSVFEHLPHSARNVIPFIDIKVKDGDTIPDGFGAIKYIIERIRLLGRLIDLYSVFFSDDFNDEVANELYNIIDFMNAANIELTYELIDDGVEDEYNSDTIDGMNSEGNVLPGDEIIHNDKLVCRGDNILSDDAEIDVEFSLSQTLNRVPEEVVLQHMVGEIIAKTTT